MKSLSLGGILRDAEQTGASNQAKAVDMATWAPRLYDTYPFAAMFQRHGVSITRLMRCTGLTTKSGECRHIVSL